NETTVVDDTDIEDDGNSCTTDVCTAGTPTHSNLPANSPCTLAGQMGLCNDMGTCKISCGMPGQPPFNHMNPCTDDPCNFMTHQCDFTPKPDGTPTPGAMQTDHDCKFHQCIGGVDTDAPDDSDLPDPQGNDCVSPTCMAGMGSLPTKKGGASCMTNGGLV